MNLYKLYKSNKLIFIIVLIVVILFLYNYFINKTIEGNLTFSQAMNALNGNNFNVYFTPYNTSDNFNHYIHIINEDNEYLTIDENNMITTQNGEPQVPTFFFSNRNILRSTNYTTYLPEDDVVYLFNSNTFDRVPASEIYINDELQPNTINSQQVKRINKFTLIDKTFTFIQSSTPSHM